MNKLKITLTLIVFSFIFSVGFIGIADETDRMPDPATQRLISLVQTVGSVLDPDDPGEARVRDIIISEFGEGSRALLTPSDMPTYESPARNNPAQMDGAADTSNEAQAGALLNELDELEALRDNNIVGFSLPGHIGAVIPYSRDQYIAKMTERVIFGEMDLTDFHEALLVQAQLERAYGEAIAERIAEINKELDKLGSGVDMKSKKKRMDKISRIKDKAGVNNRKQKGISKRRTGAGSTGSRGGGAWCGRPACR